MVYLYLCGACKEGRHEECEIAHPTPKGVYGGSKCTCCCNGRSIEQMAKDDAEWAQNRLQAIHDFEVTSKESWKTLNIRGKMEKKIEVLITGKPMAGKSTIAALIAKTLHDKGVKVHVFDEDRGLGHLQDRIRDMDNILSCNEFSVDIKQKQTALQEQESEKSGS